MFEIFVGMSVEVVVSKDFTGNQICYYGTLLESDANRIVIDITSFDNKLIAGRGRKEGKMIINNRYIISMFAAVN